MKHIDLFSGIGGFSLACEWTDIETICFVEIDKFCQKVLKKHWPNVPIVEDINNVNEIKTIADTERGRCQQRNTAERLLRESNQRDCLLLTAGFPCQPFSNAGRKRGAADDRYLWPQTLAVIESIKPDWIILENVPGILNMVFPNNAVRVASQASLFDVPDDEISDFRTISGGIESDLKQAGYETVWLVIPACAVSAPHRRDRVWIIGNATSNGFYGTKDRKGDIKGISGDSERKDQLCESKRTNSIRSSITHTESNRQPYRWDSDRDKQCRSQIYTNESNNRTTIWGENSRCNSHASNTRSTESRGISSSKWQEDTEIRNSHTIPDWSKNWYEVAAEFCRVDARIPDRVDRLKSLGNSIVPQVAYELIKNITELNI